MGLIRWLSTKLNITDQVLLFVIYLCLIFIAMIAYFLSILNPRPKKKRSLPAVSISLNKCVIAIEGTEIKVNAKNLDVLSKISKFASLYLIAQLPNEISDDALVKSIVKEDFDIPKHRVMSCSTAKGRGYMVRQLQPLIHAEVEESVVNYLSEKVANVILLEETPEGYDLSSLLPLLDRLLDDSGLPRCSDTASEMMGSQG